MNAFPSMCANMCVPPRHMSPLQSLSVCELRAYFCAYSLGGVGVVGVGGGGQQSGLQPQCLNCQCELRTISSWLSSNCMWRGLCSQLFVVCLVFCSGVQKHDQPTPRARARRRLEQYNCQQRAHSIRGCSHC